MKIMGLKKALRGFSIIELLIAIIIIGILVAIIIPRLATRAEQARIRAAESDLEEIRKAEEHAGIDTGYYYRLYVLDDNRGGDGYRWGDPNDKIDGLWDEPLNGNIHLNPTRIFINVKTGEIYPDLSASIIYTRMIENETSFNWNGRYITWQKDFSPKNDIPDDPWGHDYLFFVPKTEYFVGGLVLEPDGIVIQYCDIDTNGNIVQGSTYRCDIFDRFVILSMGPNGIPGSGPGTNFGTGDDIIQKW